MSPSNTIRVSIFSRRLGGPVGKTVDPLSARHKKGPKFNTGPDEAIFLGDLSYVLSLAHNSRWLHQMKTFSASLALCEMYPPEETRWFPSKRPVTRSFDVFFDLRLNKRLSKQSRHRWFETPSRSLWRHWNVYTESCTHVLQLTKTSQKYMTCIFDFCVISDLQNRFRYFDCFNSCSLEMQCCAGPRFLQMVLVCMIILPSYFLCIIDSFSALWPDDAYIRQRTRLSLVQLMACCLFGTKPSPEPMQAYFHLNPSFKLEFINRNAFQNVFYKMSAIFFIPQCVNSWWAWYTYLADT